MQCAKNKKERKKNALLCLYQFGQNYQQGEKEWLKSFKSETNTLYQNLAVYTAEKYW